jgi:hypothetical protein
MVIACPVDLFTLEASLVGQGVEVILIDRKAHRGPQLRAKEIPQLQRLLGDACRGLEVVSIQQPLMVTVVAYGIVSAHNHELAIVPDK